MVSKLIKAGFNTYKLGLDSIKIEKNVNEIWEKPEIEKLDEKTAFGIFK